MSRELDRLQRADYTLTEVEKERRAARLSHVLESSTKSKATVPRIEAVVPALSLVVPAYNERENLSPLYERVCLALEDVEWELVVVDDGSTDGTDQALAELCTSDPRVRGLKLARNSGQTSALKAGIDHARGELIATLDADLQNDPADLPELLQHLEDNDAIVGYRAVRNDNWIRRFSSRIGNGVRNWLTGDDIRDTGCSLKLFRAEALRTIPLFEGMHRFLPTLLRWYGFRVVEHPVSHAPRTWGESKYGVRNRAWRSFRDLLAVRWMRGRIIRIDVAALDSGKRE